MKMSNYLSWIPENFGDLRWISENFVYSKSYVFNFKDLSQVKFEIDSGELIFDSRWEDSRNGYESRCSMSHMDANNYSLVKIYV